MSTESKKTDINNKKLEVEENISFLTEIIFCNKSESYLEMNDIPQNELFLFRGDIYINNEKNDDDDETPVYFCCTKIFKSEYNKFCSEEISIRYDTKVKSIKKVSLTIETC